MVQLLPQKHIGVLVLHVHLKQHQDIVESFKQLLLLAEKYKMHTELHVANQMVRGKLLTNETRIFPPSCNYST